jgi:hypothetical protein
MAEGPSDGDCGGLEDTRAKHQWGKNRKRKKKLRKNIPSTV